MSDDTKREGVSRSLMADILQRDSARDAEVIATLRGQLERIEADRTTERRMWAGFAVLLVAAVLVLAGHAVGIEIPGLGSFSGGGE